ncbi:MAG: carboxylating nicotinate-nucleotide diphosphorylase [Pseudomonadota bacterium]
MSSTETQSNSIHNRSWDLEDPWLRAAIVNNVRAALAEDLGSGDITAQLIPKERLADGRVITRETGIMAGIPWAERTAKVIDPELEVRWLVADGDRLSAGQKLFEISGRARSILTAERTMLNFVQLLSGTATQTARYVALVAGTRARVLDTRKTLPGLRLAQKYAVTCGGGYNHRIGLFDAYLIKENHIFAAGSIAAAVSMAQRNHPGRPVEVEVERREQLEAAMAAGADIVMLDNFSLAETREAVALAAGRVLLEASGNVDEKTITAIAETGVDYISSGNLTKQIVPLDLSMRFEERAG